jgi:hypothetical protein
MTRLVGYQPQYFPRLHYYARFLNADVFKISDNLQFVRRHAYHSSDGTSSNGPSYQAHTPIKTSQGMYLLDVPVRHEGKKTERMLNAIAIDYSKGWREKQLKGIELNYKKAPQFKAIFPSLAALFSQQFPSLASYTIASTLWGLVVLFEIPIGVEVFSVAEFNSLLPFQQFRLKRVVRMSELGIERADKMHGQNVNDWIIENCRALGADEYYFGGTAAGSYIDHDRLRQAGVHLVQQEWVCAEYKQQFPKHGFLPNLSILDLLMNEPPSRAREILSTPAQ